MKPIGKPSDFDWLKELIKVLNDTFDAQFIFEGRWRGDCCIDHKDVIVCKFNVEYAVEDPRTRINKELVRTIYNLVKDYSKSSGSPHRLLHMRWSGYFFTLAFEPK